MSDKPKIHQRSRPRQGSADVEQIDVDAKVARKGQAPIEQAIEASFAQAEAGGGGAYAPPPAADTAADASPLKRGGKVAGKGGGDYDVGYGKPPKHTQFKKGQCGNPKGRPKGAKSLKTRLQEMLLRPVTINRNGKRLTMPSMMVPYEQLLQKAVKGDPKAHAEFHKLVLQFGMFEGEGDNAAGGAAGESAVSDSDMRAYAALQLDQMLRTGLSKADARKAIEAFGLSHFLLDMGAGLEVEE
ncbi:hypothetical protein PMI07_001400 [Rhizobium sp. CF080]|uniref:DUF5681 domain-containing protein n=1 Tax=Rhizobium sp. (strain CF080) TaxID=1144310 RepID=UPI000271B508|nr:DUF5681 domain-containing protein [Rhizobium sp. CF080]EUB96501.1 hypothetical protein PMI07_001400 [Rhizobium sp. CF080]